METIEKILGWSLIIMVGLFISFLIPEALWVLIIFGILAYMFT